MTRFRANRVKSINVRASFSAAIPQTAFLHELYQFQPETCVKPAKHSRLRVRLPPTVICLEFWHEWCDIVKKVYQNVSCRYKWFVTSENLISLTYLAVKILRQIPNIRNDLSQVFVTRPLLSRATRLFRSPNLIVLLIKKFVGIWVFRNWASVEPKFCLNS